MTGAALALHTSGCNVRLLGTTATEHPDPIPPLERLRARTSACRLRAPSNRERNYFRADAFERVRQISG